MGFGNMLEATCSVCVIFASSCFQLMWDLDCHMCRLKGQSFHDFQAARDEHKCAWVPPAVACSPHDISGQGTPVECDFHKACIHEPGLYLSSYHLHVKVQSFSM